MTTTPIPSLSNSNSRVPLAPRPSQEEYLSWKQDQMRQEQELDKPAYERRRQEEREWRLRRRMELLSAMLQEVGLSGLMKMCKSIHKQLLDMTPKSGYIEDLPDGSLRTFTELEGGS